VHLRLCAFVCALRHRGKSRLESELLILTCSDQRPGSAGQARASFAEFEAALDAQRLQGLDNDVARRAVFSSLLLQGTLGSDAAQSFNASDMVRAHSSWRKRVASITTSTIDAAVRIHEPDALAKTNDVRLPHQLLEREDVRPTPGKNTKWYYPQPSMEMEARRVLDFWRGQASRPWGSKQEAAQHFRRAFAFFDTLGAGRITYAVFRSGLLRLRYGLPEAMCMRLFDRIDRRGSGFVTQGDMAAPLYQPRGRWEDEGAGAVPRAWLRHSRLAAFDTSRQPMRALIGNRGLHGRGDNIHDGVQHGSDCRLPCCSGSRDVTGMHRDKGGQRVQQGYFGPPVHATWSALSEHVLGERNKFVSPPFRCNDIPVPELYECAVPRRISADAPHAHLAPVNNYVSADYEPWQAPTVRLSKHMLCKVCKGAGALTAAGRDLRSTLSGRGRGTDGDRDAGGADFDGVQAERQIMCGGCEGRGWVRDVEHECVGHAPCRNHVARCLARLDGQEPSLWRFLQHADDHIMYPRNQKPETRNPRP
jgi:hypothetical protein